MFIVQRGYKLQRLENFARLLLTSVSVEADGSMETFAMFEDVQCQQNLRALSLFLDPVEGSFQVQPETDLLQGCA